MKIATGADEKFEIFLRNLLESIYEFGYDVLIYDLGNMGYGIPLEGDFEREKVDDYKAKHPTKPWMIEDALGRVEEGRGLVYMDADTEIKKSIDNAWNWDYDVGVTLYPDYFRDLRLFSDITGYLNAGVIFFRNTKGARKFVKLWQEELPKTKTGSDQEALTRIIRGATDLKPNKTHEWKDIKIRLFACKEYNNTMSDLEGKEQARILHYAGIRQAELGEKIREKYENTAGE